VALLDEEATVKRFYREKGRVRLQPENQLLEPIYATELQILGKVIGLVRKIH
jgi:repressor LexA